MHARFQVRHRYLRLTMYVYKYMYIILVIHEWIAPAENSTELATRPAALWQESECVYTLFVVTRQSFVRRRLTFVPHRTTTAYHGSFATCYIVYTICV